MVESLSIFDTCVDLCESISSFGESISSFGDSVASFVELDIRRDAPFLWLRMALELSRRYSCATAVPVALPAAAPDIRTLRTPFQTFFDDLAGDVSADDTQVASVFQLEKLGLQPPRACGPWYAKRACVLIVK